MKEVHRPIVSLINFSKRKRTSPPPRKEEAKRTHGGSSPERVGDGPVHSRTNGEGAGHFQGGKKGLEKMHHKRFKKGLGLFEGRSADAAKKPRLDLILNWRNGKNIAF